MEEKKDEVEAGGHCKYEGKERKQVWVEYGRIRINEQRWKWDENEEVLRDEKRNRRRKVISGKKERKAKEGMR